MYSKLYSRITESSLMEEPINVRYTFVLMLAIADPEGYVIGTNVAIARRLNMELAEFEECLGVLMSPDPNSNSKDQDGRRVIVSDGERGYLLVNYVNYRDMKSPQDRRDYMREYMRRRRAALGDHKETSGKSTLLDDVSISKPMLAQLRHGDEVSVSNAGVPAVAVCVTPSAETRGEVLQSDQWRLGEEEIAAANGKPKQEHAGSARKRAPKKITSDGFESWWAVYPKRKAKEDAFKAWPKAVAFVMQSRDLAQPQAVDWLIAITTSYRDSDEGQSEFCVNGATWLNGKRWQDDQTTWDRRNGSRPVHQDPRGNFAALAEHRRRKAELFGEQDEQAAAS